MAVRTRERCNVASGRDCGDAPHDDADGISAFTRSEP
jgi:hypothetical protein